MIWNFIIQSIIMFAISLALQPKVEVPKKQPLGLDDFELPTAEEGRCLQAVFGKRRNKSPNVVWYGALKIYPIYKRVKTSLFNTKRMTIGYEYFMSVHMILGLTCDSIKGIVVGEKPAWPTLHEFDEADDGQTSAVINGKEMFGGIEKEGGIYGTAYFEYGKPSQGQSTLLEQWLGSTVPAYRGQTGIILDNMYLGNNGYIKPWSFLWKRTDLLISGTQQWYIAKANVEDDSLNAVHCIREVLTDKEMGLGYDFIDIDEDNFQDVADVLYAEGFGLSFNWDAAMPCEDIIGNILKIIDGSMFMNQATGKFQLKLARDDYNPDDLETYDENDVIEMEEYHRPGFGEIASKVTVKWTLINRDETRLAYADDPAVMKKQGNNVVESIYEYESIPNKTLANKIANRELKHQTSMLFTATLHCLKTMSNLNPYDVFKLSWKKYGLTSVIVRIVDIDYGEAADNHMTISICEDIFGVAYNIYDDPPDTLWTDPINDPVDSTIRRIIEVPYFILNNEWDDSSLLADLPDDAAFIMPQAITPTEDAYDFTMMVEDYTGSGYVDEGLGGFCPTATLVNDLAQDAVEIVLDIENIEKFDTVEAGDIAIINNEFVELTNVDLAAETITVDRAILDTLPATHSSGDRIWVVSRTINFVSREYTVSDTPRVKFLTQTGRGVLDEGSAAYLEATAFVSRMIRPYCPANLKIDGGYFPSHFVGQPELTWRHRDRTHTTQLSTIVKYDYNGSYGPEAGTTYTLYIYDEDGGLVRTEPGLTGTSYTYSEVNERSDCGLSPTDPLNSKLRFVLKAVRGSYDSFQQYDLTVQRASEGTVSAISTTSGDLTVQGGKMKGSVSATVVSTGDLTKTP